MSVLATILVCLGVGFSLLGSIGVNRLPEFFSRAHAATKPDTLGVILSVAGITMHLGTLGEPLWSPTSLKLLLIGVFVAVTNPAAAHALGRAAVSSGLKPWIPKEATKVSEVSDNGLDEGGAE